MHHGTIHVLLVEDEEAHAELIQLSFEGRADIRLEIVTTLGEARASLAESTPDLAIIDSLLPDGKGMELVRRCREESGRPIILLTSHADEMMETEAMEAGASRYVVKSEVTLFDMPRIVDRELRRSGVRDTERSL